ncbi:uromodulin-like 1 [Eleutherodactylus coqui]|uniref:uromodulin-like 1 n=1 Tax=Eleutherodactylus coqui TaxID=57060 RepID=UPI00346214D5
MDKKTLLYLTLLGMSAGLGSGWMFGSMISPWSYHVCNHTVTVNVSKIVAFQKPREEPTWCMSWIPWKLCTRTTYHTEYRMVYVPETSAVKRCCEGYEPVGHYCAMALQRSCAYASRPGTCLDAENKKRGPNCTFDYDCPGLQKCCISSNGSFCASPAPLALDRNTIKYWYNGTIIIKMGFEELIQWDEGFINHTRLLQSMVTGEFWPLKAAVYHIYTKPAGSFSIVSSVLIGINESLSLMQISAKLKNIVIRLPEVISIDIHDLDECLYPELSSCLLYQKCVNLEGSYNCTNKSHSDSIQQTTTHPDCSMLYNHSITNVTSSGFCIHWNTDCPENYTYNVQVSSKGFHHSKTIRGTTMGIDGLQAGELYTVQVTFNDCNGLIKVWNGTAKTDCSMFYNHSITNVTSSGFCIHWNTDCPENYAYNVQVSSKGFHHSKTIRGTTMGIDGLQAGDLYTVQVTFNDCNGLIQVWNGRAKTEAHIVNTTLKIDNWNLTESLQDPNSTEYDAFLKKFISEVKKSLSNEIPPERVAVEVESLTAGSIIVQFRIIVNDSEHPVNVTAASFSAFSNEFHVDTKSIVVTDLNECLTPVDNDCHLYADCKNLDRSYTCECRPSYVDRNPSRPGRNCEEHAGPLLPPMDNVDPTSGGSSVSPVDTSPTTSTRPGNLTDVTKIKSTLQERSPPGNPITATAGVTGGPSFAQSTLSTPVHRPTNATLTDQALSKSLKMVPSNLNHTIQNTTAKISAPGINTTAPLKATQLSTSDKGMTTADNVTIRQKTSRGTTCSIPLMRANVESSNTPHLVSSSVQMTTHKTPSLTLRDASTVICVMGKIGISIEKAFLKMMSIASHALFLGSRECSLNCSTDTHIFIEAGWKECNTNVESNQTHIVVNSTLYIDLSSTFQNVTPKAISSIRCMFHNEILWSSGYNPAGGIYTIIEKLEGDGKFIPEFQLFMGDQPIGPNFTLSATDDITVQIRIKTEDSQYKVVINECWATPTENSNDLISFPFIRDSCALTNTFTTIHTNGVSNNATFQTKVFSFVDNPIVYLHCRLHVCKEVPPKICKPTCNGFRSAFAGDNVFTGVTRMGPLRKSDQLYEPDSTLGPGYIVLIVIAVLVLVAMLVSILICWHERRTGNYNFKIKIPDIGYHVFSN